MMKIFSDMPELQQERNASIYSQIVPCQGWKAVFAGDFDGNMVLFTYPVVCWVLETLYDHRLSIHPVSSNVLGMIATPRLETAEDDASFVGYLPVDVDQSELADIALHIHHHLKEAGEYEDDDSDEV